jgi:molybdopterin converting factor small subunit
VTVTVHIPSPLRSYTKQQAEVNVAGSSLEEILSALDNCYPGFRFRVITEQDTIRKHIRIFVNEEQALDLSAVLRRDDEIHIICALSGG